MMEPRKYEKTLNWLRDYGIILLVAMSIFTSVQYCQHNYIVNHVIEPTVIQNQLLIDSNGVKTDRNWIKLDSLTTQFDSLLREVEVLKRQK